MISVAINVKVKQEDKRIVRVQALTEDGRQYKVRVEFCVADRVVSVKELGDMSREVNETDLHFASRILQKATEE